MSWVDLGFNNMLERHIPRYQEQPETDAQVSNPSAISESLIISSDSSLKFDLINNKFTFTDGILERKILPPPSLIVATDATGDFADIQLAIDYADQIGGATILIKAGVYKPRTHIKLKPKVTLLGEGPTRTVLDFAEASLDAGTASVYSGAVQIEGEFVMPGSLLASNIDMTTGSKNATSDEDDTQFISLGVRPGDKLVLEDGIYTIEIVENEKTLNLVETYQGNTFTNSEYQIIRPLDNMSVRNLSIINVLASNRDGLVVNNSTNIVVEDVLTDNINRVGIAVDTTFNYRILNCVSSNNAVGFALNDVAFAVFNYNESNGALLNCTAFNNSSYGCIMGDGVVGNLSKFSHNDVGVWMKSGRCDVTNSTVYRNDNDGIVVGEEDKSGVGGSKIIGNSVELNGGDGVQMNADDTVPAGVNNFDVFISKNNFNDNGAWGVDIETESNVGTRLVDNSYSGNTSGLVNDAGDNTIRSTRFVALDDVVSLLDVSTGQASFTDIDVTANTSANCYAVSINGFIETSGSANRQLQVRKNGSSTDETDNQTIAGVIATGSIEKDVGSRAVAVDTSQIFEWKTGSTASFTQIKIVLIGYWEFTG